MILVPSGEGYYWATQRSNGHRSIVLICVNGLKQKRVYRARCSGSFDLCDFKNWSKRICDPRQAGKIRSRSR